MMRFSSGSFQEAKAVWERFPYNCACTVAASLAKQRGDLAKRNLFSALECVPLFYLPWLSCPCTVQLITSLVFHLRLKRNAFMDPLASFF